MVWHACEYGATVVRRVSAYLFLIVHICLTGRMHDGVVVGVGVYLVRYVVPTSGVFFNKLQVPTSKVSRSDCSDFRRTLFAERYSYWQFLPTYLTLNRLLTEDILILPSPSSFAAYKRIFHDHHHPRRSDHVVICC